MDSRHSFHVCYAGGNDGSWERFADVLCPPYRVSRIEPGETSAGQSLPSVLESDADCLVVTDEFRDGRARRSWVEFLESVRAERPGMPIVPVVSSTSADRFRALLRADVDDIVYRADAADASSSGDPIERLRERIDDIYDESISDVGGTVLEIARSLMGAAPDEVDIEIEWGLESIGTRLNAAQCLVFDYDAAAAHLEPTHCWTATRSAEADSDPRSVAAASNATGAAITVDDAGTTASPSSSARRSVSLSAAAAEVDRSVDAPIDAAAFPGFEDSLRGFDVHAIPSAPTDAIDIDIDVPDGFIGDLAPRDDADAGDAHPYLERYDLEALLAVPIVIDWELRGVLVVGQDHRRSWPDRLRRQLRTLAELVGHALERTRRRRELVRKNERLERFSSVISHDLRNPLNVISGCAELAAETGDLEHLEHVTASADRMETMIEDLLTLARQGEELGDTEAVALETVVRDAWDAVETKDATLELADELPAVAADPGRLRQAFENLVRNAIEHNGADVTVAVEETADGFALEDDGTGISPARRDRIFEEGYSGADGTGLGLSIVDTVFSAHEWDVSITEGTRGGARFEVDTVSSADRATEPSRIDD